MAKKTFSIVDVNIAGRMYRLSTDEAPAYTHQLADFVTSQILAVKRESGASPLDCATIAAFRIADELNKCRLQLEALEQPAKSTKKN